MPLLVRYLLKELLVPLCAWVAFIFVLLVVLQFLRSTEVLLGSSVTLLDLGRVMALISPHFLVMALPIGFLLAIALGFGRLAEDREIVAFSALGVSPLSLLSVALLLGAALGALNFALVSTVEPWGLRAVKVAVADVVKKNVIGDVKSGQFYEDINQFTLYAQSVDKQNKNWRNVLIHDDRDPAAPLLVLAREGTVNTAIGGASVRLSLSDGVVHLANRSTADYTLIDFERGDINVGVESSIGSRTRMGWPREESTPMDLWREVKDLRARGDDAKGPLIALNQRVGHAFTPLAFALLGAPLSMTRRQGSRAKGLIVTMFGYVGYYVLNRFAESLAVKGAVTPMLAGQLANLTFAIVGALLFWRIARVGAAQ